MKTEKNKSNLNKEEITNIILEIKSCKDEARVRELSEKYGNYQEIYVAGISRWGELKGLEAEVIAFEIKKEYIHMETIIRELSLQPTDGFFRTRDLYTGEYAEEVETMGISYGFKQAFRIIYQEGKKLYGDKFDLILAKKAFLETCPFHGTEDYLDNVKQWYFNLEKLNGGKENETRRKCNNQ